MTDRVLVTGGTGFIGTYLLRQLVARDLRVRVLARCPARLPNDIAGSLDVIAGDICDARAVKRAVHGVDTVLHLAACARAWCRDRSEYQAVNVEAVRTLLGVAADVGVQRFVHVSTILALPPFRDAALRGAAAGPTPYEVTKQRGDGLVEAYAADGRHAAIVHPTRVYGPDPLTDANAVTKAIWLYLTGRLRVRLADGDVLANYVHAADVADGIMRAATYGRTGEHYVLGGDENISFHGLLDLVSEIAGTRRRVLPLPRSVALAAARAAEAWGYLGGMAPITPRWIRVFLEDRRASVERSRSVLGYAPRPLREGLTETIAWLRAGGAREAA